MITAADVNKLRQVTGAGMMDCKKALEESNGDFEAAIDNLRKKGQKVAAKRADRDAKEGVVIAKTNSDGLVLSRGKPATATEKAALTLEARDNSGGEQTIKFRDAVAGCSYVQSVLGKTNEVKLTSSQPQVVDGKNVVQFTLECRYPEKVR